MMTHLKRAAKELLGRKQWPRPEVARPRSYEEQLYCALLRPGDHCFDVGANQGEVSLFLAKLVGPAGSVTAFEPVWPTYRRLCATVQSDTALKAQVVTVPAGLSDAEKTATINVPGGEFELASIADAAEWAKTQPGARVESYRIQLTTLDAVLAAAVLTPPDFLKIDVEGAELFVLRGAEGTFAGGHRPLMVIEVFAPWERAFGYRPWEPLSWLMARGYRFLFACPNGLVEYTPTADAPFPPDYAMGYNVVAYHPDAHADRIDRVQHLRAGSLTDRLPMALPPQPNSLT